MPLAYSPIINYTPKEDKHIYVLTDNESDESLAFYSDPDKAITHAKAYLTNELDDVVHIKGDVEVSSLRIYRVPFERIMRDDEFYNDCIWESLDTIDTSDDDDNDE